MFFKAKKQPAEEGEAAGQLSLLEKKDREKGKGEKKEKGRWAIGALLLGTIGLSLFFYLRQELAGRAAKFFSPAVVISQLPKAAEERSRKTEEFFKQTVAGKTGRYGFYVQNLGEPWSYGVDEEKAFPAASLIKLPIMVAAYRLAEAGGLDLEGEYVLKEEDKRNGAGALYNQAAGTVYTWRKLLELMGKQSDNTAARAVLNRVGEARVNQLLSEQGMVKTSLAENETTPAEIGQLLVALKRGEVLNRENTQELLGFLTETIFEDRLPAGIPEGVTVAHKVGTDLGVVADAGVVEAVRPFVLVMMSEGVETEEATGVIVALAEKVYEEEEK